MRDRRFRKALFDTTGATRRRRLGAPHSSSVQVGNLGY